MYKANLSFAQLNDYLTFMLKNDLISQQNSDDKEVYKVTKKGIDFITKHQELTCLLKTFPKQR